MKYLKNLFQSKYFKSIISVFFVAVASIFTGYFIVNGANYMSSNFLNIDSGGAYIYGNPTGNGLVVANGKVGISETAPNTRLHVNAPAGADVLRIQATSATKLFVDDTGFIGVGGYFTPSSALEVAGNIETDSILNRNLNSLLTTEYVNSDVDANQVWTSNVLTVNNTSDCGTNCWNWAPGVSTTLTSPALGFRLRGSSDDGGACWVYVANLFTSNITNRGYTPAYTLGGSWPVGGQMAGSGAGDMLNHTYIFSDIASGRYYNQLGSSMVDNWGYLKPVGLDIIPAGRTVYMYGGSWDGGGGQYVNCYLDVLYATEYKPL